MEVSTSGGRFRDTHEWSGLASTVASSWHHWFSPLTCERGLLSVGGRHVVDFRVQQSGGMQRSEVCLKNGESREWTVSRVTDSAECGWKCDGGGVRVCECSHSSIALSSFWCLVVSVRWLGLRSAVGGRC